MKNMKMRMFKRCFVRIVDCGESAEKIFESKRFFGEISPKNESLRNWIKKL